MTRRARPSWDNVAALRIAEERATRGWSQQRTADELGVDRKTVGRWESGESSPEAAQLRSLAVSGWDVLYILTGSRSGSAVDGPARDLREAEAGWSELGAEELALLACWRELSAGQRQAVEAIMRELRAKSPAPIEDGAGQNQEG